MPQLTLEGCHYQLRENETVLDCLLRHGVAVKNSCRSGLCQSCLLKTAHYESTKESSRLYQIGLNTRLIEQGYFLACQTKPSCDLKIGRNHDHSQPIVAKVCEKKIINDSICILRLGPEGNSKWPAYRGGQFINIWLEEQWIRSYSIASVDNSALIELHIKRFENGKVSRQVYEEVEAGSKIFVQGPFGTSYYSKDCMASPLVFVGMGTGLAPMMGVLKAAIANDHQQRIDFFACARYSSNLYFHNELIQLESKHPNLKVHFVAQVIDDESSKSAPIISGDIYQLALSRELLHDNTKIYLGGSESLVGKLKKKYFLAGIPLPNIRADAFKSAYPG